MDIRAIQELIAAMEASSLSRVHYEDKTVKITLEKPAGPGAAVSAVFPADSKDALPADEGKKAKTEGTVVSAPIVGTVYRAREQGQKPLVSVGDPVRQGDALCLIETMKLFSEVVAPCAGVVTEIHFTDGELAEFGMPLMTIGEKP